jgi:hypothetical protein
MTGIASRALFWTPRLLGIAFALFVGMFALDAFNEGHGFWQNLAGFGIHLAPAMAIAAALAIAWRHEWVAALLFPILGVFFLLIARGLFAKLVFGGVPFATAALFLVQWFLLRRNRLVPHNRDL